MVARPAGGEGAYRELEERDGTAPTATPAFERLVTVAARYGMTITVPEAGDRGGKEAGMEQG